MSRGLGRVDAPPVAPEPVPVLDGAPETAAVAASSAAAAAAAAAGLVVREATGRQEFVDVCDLLADIWRERPEDRAQTPVMLRAFSYSGNYVAVALRGDDLVGACVGYFGLARQWELHSHIAGVAAHARGRSVGFALKVHQRAWALARGIDTISWTFDPLIRRNAYFNMCKLGALPRAYEPDFYGAMSDGINSGDRSDRLVVEWPLAEAQVRRACAGTPHEFDTDELRADGADVALGEDAGGRPRRGQLRSRYVFVNPPRDIERMRETDAATARLWRYEVRYTLCGLLAQGARIIGYSRRDGYVLDRSPV